MDFALTDAIITEEVATEAARTCSRLAIQVHDEGTSQIQKLIVGRAETAIDALA